MLAGTSNKNIAKFQIVQNSLARLISGTRHRDHIKPVFKFFHWLPVSERIQYKVALITHKVIVLQQPKYLGSAITIYKPKRDLRSATLHYLTARATETKTGDRSFGSTAKRVWDKLPIDLRVENNTNTFKSKLKTHLFNQAYCL